MCWLPSMLHLPAWRAAALTRGWRLNPLYKPAESEIDSDTNLKSGVCLHFRCLHGQRGSFQFLNAIFLKTHHKDWPPFWDLQPITWQQLLSCIPAQETTNNLQRHHINTSFATICKNLSFRLSV